jgi:hypothetical protein
VLPLGSDWLTCCKPASDKLLRAFMFIEILDCMRRAGIAHSWYFFSVHPPTLSVLAEVSTAAPSVYPLLTHQGDIIID